MIKMIVVAAFASALIPNFGISASFDGMAMPPLRSISADFFVDGGGKYTIRLVRLAEKTEIDILCNGQHLEGGVVGNGPNQPGQIPAGWAGVYLSVSNDKTCSKDIEVDIISLPENRQKPNVNIYGVLFSDGNITATTRRSQWKLQ